MSEKEEFFEEGKKGEEEPLGFEFDELSQEEIKEVGGESSSDEEIIELVDVVEKGKLLEGSGSDEIASLPDEEAIRGEARIEEGADLTSDELAQIPDEKEISQSFELDKPSVEEGPESAEGADTAFELLETDLETKADFEMPEGETAKSEGTAEPEAPMAEPVEQAGLERPGSDVPPELPQEDLSEVVPGSQAEIESRKVIVSPGAEELSGISEERIEAIITRVVEDVVERVAMEAMANVANRVITAAIDSIKQSLQSPQD